ncbi:MAG: efflux RND transporter permease subunit [Selenomonas sp.]|uniref:efflux RND transporter permease subunit n=1 Tax=Selenomonas sp. TaxID=2053611 RepID=UPI0025F44B2D|nr:efflux RND transporter permease subunit [Selenomonas sp.]MCR5757766.1 efflux RND transporter permease subunit [Selenomonas sp.]
MSLPEISIKRPVFATVVLAALILMGIVNYGRMNVDEMPDTSFPYVSVSIPYEGAQPDQVETQVTRKVEEAVGEARGVKHIESISREGESEVNVEFNFGVDPTAAAQEVRDKVSAIRGELPDSVKEPVISRFDMNAQPVVSVAITSDSVSMREMSIFVKDVLKPRLQKISGVGQLSISGTLEREIQLQLDQEKLNTFGLSVAEVGAQLKEVNQDVPAGKLENRDSQLMVRTAGNFRKVQQFDEVVVANRSNMPIYFWQVGTVHDTVKESTSSARFDGKPAIAISIGKQSGGNAVKVATAVKQELAQLQAELPVGMEMQLVKDDAQRVAESIHEVWFDLIVGSLFAVLIVFWFLGDWRSTVISALAIPASIASTFLFMKLAGFSINSMSLLGLSLSVGLLIDDAIVVVENIIRHRNMGKDAKQAAKDGTKEIALAVMATTFTVAAVFLPVGFMSGIDGQMFKEFGLSIAFAVLVSLFVSFTLTPMMAALYLPVGKPSMPSCLQKAWQKWQRGFSVLTDWYGKTLRILLYGYRCRVLGGALALFLLSLTLLPLLGSTFMPTTDQAQFTVKVQAPANSTVEFMDKQSAELTAVLQKVPEVRHVYATTAKREHNIFVQLAPKKERQRSQQKIIGEVRQCFNALPGIRADFLQGEDKPIAISITGPSLAELTKLSEQVWRELEQVPGVTDIASTYHGGLPNLNLQVKEERASDLAISSQSIGTTMQTLLSGAKVGNFGDGDERIDIRMKLSAEGRTRADMLRQVYVPSSRQAEGHPMLVPLSQVASWQYTTSASDIRRYDRQREIRLTANVEGTSMGEANEAFFARLENMQVPVNYKVGQAGASNDMDDSFGNMAMALAMAVAFIFMILAAQFESYSEPFAIMFSLPLAMIGALAGLFLAGSEISLVSLIGIMMLMGLVTKNAILLIDFAKRRIREGVPCKEALVEAGCIRLRPILMTSTAMIFGMVPIALGIGPGAEARAPMAHAIIGGVLTSTVLTLVIIPMIYDLLHQYKNKSV